MGVSPELEREMERRVNEEGAGVHDEFGCANLVVVVPEGVKKDELLPVMVWCVNIINELNIGDAN